RRDRPRRLGLRVEPRQLVPIARRPDDVRIDDVGQREPRLASAEVVFPLAGAAASERSSTEPAGGGERGSIGTKSTALLTSCFTFTAPTAPAPAASPTALHGVVRRVFGHIARTAHRAV